MPKHKMYRKLMTAAKCRTSQGEEEEGEEFVGLLNFPADLKNKSIIHKQASWIV